ncbi:ribbon-helix-helix protein, CopG family [Haloarcula amylovorans]|uniref:ribbon-helix-helix protein, CopG family n=1 Tax=Haloarcula amylovorans TaxID=2562280 RepID=UPI00107615F8|nr:ribbon-helix-helix protein, CopG family [Halomicroarcula amylolytica]
MTGRLTQNVSNERVTLRISETLLEEVEETVDGVDGYGRCDFIREAVDEKLEKDDIDGEEA